MNECDLFIAALDKPSLPERQAFLEEACRGDQALRRRVESLLASHNQAGSLLEHPALDRDATVATSQSDVSTSGEGTSAVAGLDEVRLDFLVPDDDSASMGRLGPYKVTGFIGRGGMGVVLKAHDAKLNRRVAIKVLAPELASSDSARQRFIREAQAAAAVVHPHVVTIHAVDDVPLPYLVMEHIDGLSLQEKIDRDGPLRTAEIVRIGWQVALGLRAAHAQGLVHRDIKPANILLETGEERIKITDFGLAHAVDDARTTQAGTIVGTPQYMSPEQALGQPVDQRSDLFSLGSVLYAMCTGRCPFQADSTVTALRRVCEETPQPIRELNPNIPPWLCQLIERLLAKESSKRIQTAGEIAELLSRPPNSEVRSQKPEVRLSGPSQFTKRKTKTQNLSLLVAPLAALLVAAAAVWVVIKNKQGQEVARIAVPDGGSVTVSADSQATGADAFRLPGTGTQLPEIPLSTAPKTSIASEQLPPVEIRHWQAHAGLVAHLALSPDGKTLASSSKDRTIRLWNGETGNLLYSLESHTDVSDPVAFSPDGTLVASGSHDKTVKWWDVASGKLLGTFAGHTNRVRAVVFAPDGKSLFTAGEDCTLRRVVLSTGEDKRLATFPFRIGVRSLALNGRTLAVSTWGDSLVRFWDTETETEKSTIMIGGVVAEALAFEPKGQLVAEGGYDVVHLALWDSSRKLKFNLRGHTRSVTGVAFAPDARLLVSVGGQWNRADLPGEIKIWDTTTGQELANLNPGPGCVFSVVVAADGKTCFTAHHDGTIRQWRLPPAPTQDHTKPEA